MTEETEVPEQEPQAPEYSEAEKQAMEMGWQPEESFKADPKNEGKKWRSAEDFLDRKPLFDKIDDLGKKVKLTEKALQSLADQSRRAEQIGYQRALDELKAQKKVALDEGDHDKVVQIDDQIADLKMEKKQAPVPNSGPPPEFVEWVERNSWYKTDAKLRAAADGIGMQYIKEGLPPAEVLANVERDLKELFPVKFTKPKAPPSVESGNRRGSVESGAESVKSKMTEVERRIMKTIISTGLSEAEYLKQFVDTQPDRFKGVKL